MHLNGTLHETWFFEWDYDSFGSTDWIAYPCTGSACGGDTPAREIEVAYDQGLMVGIDDANTGAQWASTMTWHPNFTLAKVTHGNNLVETITADPNGMARPLRFTWAQGGTSSNTGDYKYDGAGNVSRMGPDHFQYDKVSRLVYATLGSLGRTQESKFDKYGNLTSLKTDGGLQENIAVRGTTNRQLLGGYDASGNLTSWNGNTYAWSPVDTLTSWTNGSEGWSYVYTADDERLLALSWTGGRRNWTVRDFGNRVLRRDERLPSIGIGLGEPAGDAPANLAACPGGTPSTRVFCDGFENGNAADWSSYQAGPRRTVTDYVWRGAQLLGSQQIGDPWRHFGLDHLGTIRVVTGDIPDGFVGEHTYFPFGREATPLGQDAEAMKFTGHERDLQSTVANQNDDLDYMHARFASPVVGRFLSFDPIGGNARFPQSWNRYAYVVGNPLRFVDPLGLAPEDPGDTITVTGEDPCPGAPDGMTCDEWMVHQVFVSTFDGMIVESRSVIQDGGGDFILSVLTHVGNNTRGIGKLGEFVADESTFGLASALRSAVEGDFTEAGAMTAFAIFPGPLDNVAAAMARRGRRFSPDVEALVGLAKEGRRTGVTRSQADTLMGWAKEYKVMHQDHIDTNHWIGGPHIRIGPINHIPVR